MTTKESFDALLNAILIQVSQVLHYPVNAVGQVIKPECNHYIAEIYTGSFMNSNSLYHGQNLHIYFSQISEINKLNTAKLLYRQ